MSRPRYEVADVFRLFGEAYRRTHPLSPEQASAMALIERCRTEALGGHLYACDHCGYEHPAYNSCRNRHCPKCQTVAKESWLAQRMGELIPVPYYHKVFTLPHQLNPWVRANPAALLQILFAAVAEVLQAFAHDPAWRLEGQLGFLSVLHTWNQRMLDHFHLHCVVPAAVLDARGRLRIGRSRYLFKNESLAKAFRYAYCRRLEELHRKEPLSEPAGESFLPWPKLLNLLRHQSWNTYSKPPFGGPAQVLEYLGRYTHRVAISNHRIQSIDGGEVTFTWRDRAEGNREKTATIPGEEFIRRFLLHILPPGFRKIRYYGWMASCNKTQALLQIRAQLDVPPPPVPKAESVEELMLRLTGEFIHACPRCHHGRLHPLRVLAPVARAPPTAHTGGS